MADVLSSVLVSIRDGKATSTDYLQLKDYIEENAFSELSAEQKKDFVEILQSHRNTLENKSDLSPNDMSSTIIEKLITMMREFAGDHANAVETAVLQSQLQDHPDLDDEERNEAENAEDPDLVNGPKFYVKYLQLLGAGKNLRPPQVVFLVRELISMALPRDSVLGSTSIQYLILAIQLFNDLYMEHIEDVKKLAEAVCNSIQDNDQADDRSDFETWYKESFVDLQILENNGGPKQDLFKNKAKRAYDAYFKSNPTKLDNNKLYKLTQIQVNDLMIGIPTNLARTADNTRLEIKSGEDDETRSHITNASGRSNRSQQSTASNRHQAPDKSQTPPTFVQRLNPTPKPTFRRSSTPSQAETVPLTDNFDMNGPPSDTEDRDDSASQSSVLSTIIDASSYPRSSGRGVPHSSTSSTQRADNTTNQDQVIGHANNWIPPRYEAPKPITLASFDSTIPQTDLNQALLQQLQSEIAKKDRLIQQMQSRTYEMPPPSNKRQRVSSDHDHIPTQRSSRDPPNDTPVDDEIDHDDQETENGQLEFDAPLAPIHEEPGDDEFMEDDASDQEDVDVVETEVEAVQPADVEFKAAKQWYEYLYRAKNCRALPGEGNFLFQSLANNKVTLIQVLNGHEYSCVLHHMHKKLQGKVPKKLTTTQIAALDYGKNPYEVKVFPYDNLPNDYYLIDYFLAKKTLEDKLPVTDKDKTYSEMETACAAIHGDFWNLNWQELVTLKACEIDRSGAYGKKYDKLSPDIKSTLKDGLLCPMLVYKFLQGTASGVKQTPLKKFKDDGRLIDTAFSVSTVSEEGMLTDYIYWMLLMTDKYLYEVNKNIDKMDGQRDELNKITSHFCTCFSMLAHHIFSIPQSTLSFIRTTAATDMSFLQEHESMHDIVAAFNQNDERTLTNTKVMITNMISKLFGHDSGVNIAVHGLIKNFVLAVQTARQAVICLDLNLKKKKLAVENLYFTWFASLLLPESILQNCESLQTAYQHNILGVVASPQDFIPACLNVHKYLQSEQDAFLSLMHSIAGQARVVSLYPSMMIDIIAQSVVLRGMLSGNADQHSARVETLCRHLNLKTEHVKNLNQAMRFLAQYLYLVRYFPRQREDVNDTTIYIYPTADIPTMAFEVLDTINPKIKSNADRMADDLNLFIQALLNNINSPHIIVRAVSETHQKLVVSGGTNYKLTMGLFDAGRKKGPPARTVFPEVDSCGGEWMQKMVLEKNKNLKVPKANFKLIGAVVDMQTVFCQKFDMNMEVIGSCPRPIWEWDIAHLVYATGGGVEYYPAQTPTSTKDKSFVCAYHGNAGKEARKNTAVWFEGISNSGKTTQFIAAMMLQCAFQKSSMGVTILPQMKIDAPMKRGLVESGIMLVSSLPERTKKDVRFDRSALSKVGGVIFLDDATTSSSTAKASWSILLDDSANFSLVPYIVLHQDLRGGGVMLRGKVAVHAILGKITHDKTRIVKTLTKSQDSMWYNTIKDLQNFIKNKHEPVRYVAVCVYGAREYVISEKQIFQNLQGKSDFVCFK